MLTFIILITIGGLYVYGKWGGAMWLATVVLMDLYFSCGNEKCYREIIEDYPVEDCIKPRRYKFLFKNSSGQSILSCTTKFPLCL